MLPRITIITSILFITHASHSMEKEIVKKQLEPNPTFKKYLIIQEIDKNNQTPSEISLASSYIALEQECLKQGLLNKDRTMCAWDDVHIPINYHLILGPTHIRLLNNILLNPPKLTRHYTNRCYHSLDHHYFLQSKEDYQLFLALPIAVRKCLAQAPKLLIHNTKELLDAANAFGIPNKVLTFPTKVNEHRTIQVVASPEIAEEHQKCLDCKVGFTAEFIYYVPRPIVPEEKQPTHQ